MGQPQPTTAFRHPKQHFIWMGDRWDIAKLLTDIDAGTIRPKKDVVDRDFIEQFAQQILCLKKDDPTAGGHGILMSVDVKRALALPAEALQEPIIFLNRGKNKGLLRLDGQTGADSILGDGSHRVTRAFFGDVKQLDCYILSLAQSKKYLMR
jgi:hypothetical protein